MYEFSASLDAVRGMDIFCAYNANVDAIVKVDSQLAQLLPPPRGRVPEVLDSPGDLTTSITRSMARGIGDEVAISKQLEEWLEARLTPEERRVGGQAGIMADLLSIAGAAPILYTHLLSATQQSVFQYPEKIRFPSTDGSLLLVPLTDVPEEQQTKTNWVFEFDEGTRLFQTTAAGTSRFIAASRPDEFTLNVGSLAAHATELGERSDCAILSGLHSLKSEYGDGTTYRDQLSYARSFIVALIEETPVQVEYGVAHDEGLRKEILSEIIPHASVLSFDTGELNQLASDLGIGSVAENITERAETLQSIRAELGIPAVKLHAKEYFLAVIDDYADRESIQNGFRFAAVVAATKAKHGQISDISLLEDGLAVAPSEIGAEQTNQLQGVTDVIAVPNRVYSDPVSTVGIGDTVSCASFVVEQALSNQ